MSSSVTTVTNASATAVKILANRTNRAMCSIVNDSTWILYVSFNSSPTSSNYKYKLGPLTGSVPYTLELPKDIYDRIWVKDIYGIWVVGPAGGAINGKCLATEEF